MEQALDRLRDKTLSFWCRIHVEAVNENGNQDAVEVIVNYIDSDTWLVRDTAQDFCKLWDVIKIIWKPLTRWRLSYLRSKLGETDEWFKIAEIPIIFEEHIELYDQDETQWMSHKKRPELFVFLNMFSHSKGGNMGKTTVVEQA